MKRMWVTQTLLWVNIFVFLMMVGYGGSSTIMHPDPRVALVFGADYGPLTLGHGQYWRIITSMFVHFGALHLLLNMWCFWSLGRLSEQLFGSLKTLGIYFAAGVGGACLSLFMNPMVVSAGASGAIFGLAGALAALLLTRKDMFAAEPRAALLQNIVFFVVINLALGSTMSGIDMSAHVGGLVAGFLAGAGFGRTLE